MKSIAEINAIRDKMQSEILLRDNADQEQETQIIVGMGTTGIAAGAVEVFNTLVEEVMLNQLHGVKISRAGSLGEGKAEPVVEVQVPKKDVVTYEKVDAAKAKEIVAKLKA